MTNPLPERRHDDGRLAQIASDVAQFRSGLDQARSDHRAHTVECEGREQRAGIYREQVIGGMAKLTEAVGKLQADALASKGAVKLAIVLAGLVGPALAAIVGLVAHRVMGG